MLEIRGKDFYLDDKKINIYSGTIHYFRTVDQDWEDRLTKLKLAGFNTVETYVCWNLHEPKKGEFCFDGMLDIKKFLQIAQKVGLYAIVRPGPYICAEWDFGGLPAWLLKDKNMQLRCNYPDYLQHVSDFYHRLYEEIAPMQITRGGNIIAMQVENEYGSYANDKEYLKFIKNLMIECGTEVLLFTSDGYDEFMLSGGTLPDVYTTLNFGSRAKTAFKALKLFEKDDAPKACSEFWCGWFDHWGEKHHTRPSLSVTHEIKSFFDLDASFNFYMFHGGTNFGFTAGANYADEYQPTVTSYDYCAMLTEWGDYTPAYHAVRKLMHEKQGLEMKELPPSPKLQHIGTVQLNQTASLMKNLDNIGQKHHTPMAESMEYYDQNFGLIYYETKAVGRYKSAPVTVHKPHDRAYVFLDGELKGIANRIKPKKKLFGKKEKPIMLGDVNGEKTIGVLVDAMGRVNYGIHLYDREGMRGVTVGQQWLMGYDVWTLPLDNLEKLVYDNGAKYPLFMKGTFKTQSNADCFVRLDGFKKGYVFVNGFNLGRYWEIGPQKTLYLPGALLKEENEIIVLELEGCKKAEITITDKHDLG